MPVHLYGQCADMDALARVAGQAGVPLIEDAAQAIGSRLRESAGGEHGACRLFLVLPEQEPRRVRRCRPGDDQRRGVCANASRLLRTHGAERQYHHRLVGGNFRIDALQAAVLRVKAPRLAGWSDARRRNAARYRQLFREAGLDGRVTLPVEGPGHYHIYNQFVVRVPERDRIKAALADRQSAPPSTIPSHSISRSASRRSATPPAHFRTPKRPPARRSRCPSTASSPTTSSRTWSGRWPRRSTRRAAR